MCILLSSCFNACEQLSCQDGLTLFVACLHLDLCEDEELHEHLDLKKGGHCLGNICPVRIAGIGDMPGIYAPHLYKSSRVRIDGLWRNARNICPHLKEVRIDELGKKNIAFRMTGNSHSAAFSLTIRLTLYRNILSVIVFSKLLFEGL